jgi:hypothetical protein
MTEGGVEPVDVRFGIGRDGTVSFSKDEIVEFVRCERVVVIGTFKMEEEEEESSISRDNLGVVLDVRLVTTDGS